MTAAVGVAVPAALVVCRWCGHAVHLRQCCAGWYWVHVDGAFPCRTEGVHRSTYAEPVEALTVVGEVSRA